MFASEGFVKIEIGQNAAIYFSGKERYAAKPIENLHRFQPGSDRHGENRAPEILF